MPHRYQEIKASIQQQHPNMPLKEVKTHAAKIYESSREPGEMHIQTAAARERAMKVKGVKHRRNFD